MAYPICLRSPRGLLTCTLLHGLHTTSSPSSHFGAGRPLIVTRIDQTTERRAYRSVMSFYVCTSRIPPRFTYIHTYTLIPRSGRPSRPSPTPSVKYPYLCSFFVMWSFCTVVPRLGCPSDLQRAHRSVTDTAHREIDKRKKLRVPSPHTHCPPHYTLDRSISRTTRCVEKRRAWSRRGRRRRRTQTHKSNQQKNTHAVITCFLWTVVPADIIAKTCERIPHLQVPLLQIHAHHLSISGTVHSIS